MEATVVEERALAVREVFVYVCWGGYLERGGKGMVTYHGGSSDCVWVRQNMGVDDVVKLVEETMGEGLREHRLWYNTKFDRNMIMPLQRDGDVGKLVKGNDQYAYMYVAEKEGPNRQPMQVNGVGGVGYLQGTSSAGGKGGGCTREANHAVQNDGRRSCSGMMARVDDDRGGQQSGDGMEVGDRQQAVYTPDEDSDESVTDFESDIDGVEGMWSHSGVNSEAYKRRKVIWKNEIIGKV